MKMAIIPGTFFPDPGGAQVQAHNLANKLCETGNSTDIILLNKTDIIKKKYKIIYLNKILINTLFIFHYYLKTDLTFLLQPYLKRLIIKNKYKIWHFIFTNYKSLLIINILKKLDQKIIITFQGADIQIDKKIQYGNRLDTKYEVLLKKTLKNVDLFTAISKNIVKDIRKLNINSNKIIEIPNGTLVSKVLNIKKIFNKQNNKILKIITVARYANKKKGFDLVKKIIKGLVAKKIIFKWTIIGKNTSILLKDNYNYKNKDSLNIIENISSKNEMYFPNSKIFKCYLESDIYLNLSRIESFGITFIEALSCNLPIITFDRKGANEIVRDKYNGFKIKNNDYKKFINYLIFFKNNKKYLKKNPFLSSKKYDLDNLVKKYIKIYSNLIDSGK